MNVCCVYLASLAPQYRAIVELYKIADMAMKVVGMGSVGTLCIIPLLMASDEDPLILQLKEAEASVLEPYAEACEYKNHGQRVAVGQRFMQAASDMLLGWSHGDMRNRDFYIRQLRDMKMSIVMVRWTRIRSNIMERFVGVSWQGLMRGRPNPR